MRRISIVQQAAANLREGLRQGHWRGHLSAMARMAVELDVSRDTVLRVLRQLESDGLLSLRDQGRRRAIIIHGQALGFAQAVMEQGFGPQGSMIWK